jgi:hypothetical protein
MNKSSTISFGIKLPLDVAHSVYGSVKLGTNNNESKNENEGEKEERPEENQEKEELENEEEKQPKNNNAFDSQQIKPPAAYFGLRVNKTSLADYF